MNKNYLFSAFTRPPRHPFSVVIKEHKTKDMLYVTYGRGRKHGGGSWSEDIRNIHPRTISMIENYFDQKTFARLQKAIQKTNNNRGLIL
jgi:hypothetical protein